MKAVIMAGGKGTRLKPLTTDTPKPLVSVLGKPVISYIMSLLISCGADDITFTLGYRPEKIQKYLKNYYLSGVKVSTVIETQPLGTAGSVKNAVKDIKEDFVVMSGDGMCDIDIKEAMDFHKSVNADITIVTTKVNDPREYGLILSDNSNQIIGFSEKPGWSNITSDMANTGIYIVSPNVLSLIPNDEPYDFSSDLFPKMQSMGKRLFAYSADGYWCDIGNVNSYRECVRDVLDGKTAFCLPIVCEGIYAKSELPKGNFSLIPPVYIGENADISDGAKIGPYAVIGDGCFVGKNAEISDSVMFNYSAVFDNAIINGAVLCKSSAVKENGEMHSGSALGAGSVIGKNTRVFENVLVFDNITVNDGADIKKNIVSADYKNEFLGDFGLEGSLLGDLPLSVCCEAGQAIASGKYGRRTGIACDGKTSSSAVVKAITGGLITGGAHVFDFGNCFLSELRFYTSFCSLGCGIYVSEKGEKTLVSFCGEGGLTLSREADRDFEKRMESGEFNRCGNENMRGVSDMTSMGLMYRRELLRQSGDMLTNASANVISDNEEILLLMEDCLFTLGCKKGDEITLKISADGTELSVFHRTCGWVKKDRLLAICCLYEVQCGHDIAVPYDAPEVINSIAAGYERKVLRYLRTPPDNSDSEARHLASKQIFARDGLFMAIKLLGIMRETGYSFPELLSQIPDFFIKHKSVIIDFPPSRLKELFKSDNIVHSKEGILCKKPNGRVLIIPSRTGKRLDVFSEAANYEISQELFVEAESIIKNNHLHCD